jgi:hypothetical protein
MEEILQLLSDDARLTAAQIAERTGKSEDEVANAIATLETDQVRLDELWSPSWRLWFPDGKADPELCLIRVEPSAAEYWDRTGANRLEFIWRAGKALLKGEKTADDKLSGHGKVDLGETDGPK